MNNLFKASIFKKILIIGEVCLLISIWSVSFVNIYNFKNGYLDSFKMNAQSIMMQFEIVILTAMYWGEDFRVVAKEQTVAIGDFINQPEMKKVLTKIGIVDNKGVVLAHFDPKVINTKIPSTIINQLNSETAIIREKNSYDVYIPFKYEDENHGYFFVGFNEKLINDKIDSSVRDSIYFTILSLFLTGVVFAFSIAHFVTNPLKYITDQIHYITESGNLSVQVKVDSKDEIQVLSDDFNLMIEKLRFAYGRFVPEQFFKILGKENVIHVKLGDQIHDRLSILFSDIRSFTTLSESMSPQENFNFINSYLNRMEPYIYQNNGVVDKFIGDAIMALFANKAEDSVNAAIGMQFEVYEYNKHRKKCGYTPIKVGIGINTGDMMLGIIGAKNRMDGTVISDAVNLGARIESLTKLYNASILISESTYCSLEDHTVYNLRVVDQVIVKGKTEPITVFEVFDSDAPEVKESKLQTAKIYETAISIYYQKQFKEAIGLFNECLQIFPTDKVAKIYHERCQHYLKVGWDENWDGVERMVNK